MSRILSFKVYCILLMLLLCFRHTLIRVIKMSNSNLVTTDTGPMNSSSPQYIMILVDSFNFETHNVFHLILLTLIKR